MDSLRLKCAVLVDDCNINALNTLVQDSGFNCEKTR